MQTKIKYFKQISPYLEKRIGRTKTQAVMNKALARYAEIVRENKDEPKEYYMHTRERIYPSIAMFDAMSDVGIERQEIIDFLIEYYKWRASGVAPFVRGVLKIPFLYKAVPKFFFNMTQRSFGPQMGFASKNKYLDKSEMRFDMTKCPYYDSYKRYGCVEIVRGFCDADVICYGNMHPRLSFDRTKTLGYGDDVCDFKIRIL